MVILFFSFGDFTNNYLQIYIQKYLKCRSHFINTDWESDATDGDDALMHWWITWHFWLSLNLDSKGGGYMAPPTVYFCDLLEFKWELSCIKLDLVRERFYWKEVENSLLGIKRIEEVLLALAKVSLYDAKWKS